MDLITFSAISYASVTLIVVGFQLALAGGAPWGEFAMGGKYPGQLPPPIRIAAIIQAALLSLLAVVILSHAGITDLLPTHTKWPLWSVVGISAISLLMNLLTPSKKERMIWAPTATIMLLASLVVALSA